MIRLKICGMRDESNIREVSELSPDYMGFIFYSQSPRYVGKDFVMPRLPGIMKIGVFVNESTDEILKKVIRHDLQFIQLHGGETVEQCQELKNHNLLIIKVFSVDSEFDFRATQPFAQVSDFFLFDTKGRYFGGNSRTFDWTLLDAYDQSVPFFLSGGIGLEEVREIERLKNMNIHAIDVNSGAEILPGLKDVNTIKSLKNILRKAH